MYRVFLVDDEIAAREAIRAAAPWEELGFELAGETADGEMALSMLREARPDLLITDIRMPYMDGMELCRWVRRELPDARIVIVSACADFACAREALALGVREFLPKPVSAAALREALERVAVELREESALRERDAALRRYMASSGRILRDHLLEELYAGGADEEALLRSARALRMNLTAKRYLVALLRPAGSADERDLRAICGALEGLEAMRGGTAFLRRSGPEFSLLVLGDGAQHLRTRAAELVEAARAEALRAAGVELAVRIGADAERLAEVPASFADARARWSEPDAGGVGHFRRRQRAARLPDPGLPPLMELMRYAAPGDVDALVDRRAEELGAADSDVLAGYLYVDAMLTAARIARDVQGAHPEVVPDQLRAQGGAEALLPLCKDALRRALTFRDSRGSTRYGGVIRKARAYIDAHFTESGLALRDVAAHVALSNNHFCTVFSQEMGVTFSEYLTELRVRRAKELLRDTNLRTGEIADAVGYNDPHYFSNLFKKNTGFSPRDYRKENDVNKIGK